MSTNNKEPMADHQPVVPLVDPSESMQCSDHPYRSNPGGICAFCLQEKLGKLVSSSNTSTPFFISSANPSTSSFSPSPRPSMASSSSSSFSFHHKKKQHLHHHHHPNATATATAVTGSSSIVKRSKSVPPRPLGAIPDGTGTGTTDSPRKKSFWSFLYHEKKIVDSVQNKNNNNNKTSSQIKTNSNNYKEEDNQEVAVASVESPSPASSSSFGRKVARSRSVGCGSRSFSGDFLERISTGFGDCTLRRVESHRESNKMVIDENARMKERVKCGGFFGGFGMVSGSASSYWLSAAAASVTEEEFDGGSGRRGRGRSRSWAWAFASPIRAFRPASSSSSSSSASKGYNNAITTTFPAANSNNGKMINGVNGNGKIGGNNGNSSLLAVGS